VHAEGIRIPRTSDPAGLAWMQGLTADRLHVAGTDRMGVESAAVVQGRFLERPADAPAATAP